MFSVVLCHCEADTILRHCEAWNKPWQSHAVCHAERSRSISSLATRYQRGLSLVGFEEILRYTQNDGALMPYATEQGMPNASTRSAMARKSSFSTFVMVWQGVSRSSE